VTALAAVAVTMSVAIAQAENINIEIGSRDAGSSYDVLDVSGTILLDGTLHVSFLNGFTPASSDVFNFLDAGNILGSFDKVEVIGGTFDLSTSGTSASLSNFVPVPEPSAFALMATMFLMVAGFAWFKRARTT
jgi:hypothetical protein